LPLIDEAQIDLVHKRGRLKRVTDAFHLEVPTRHAMKLCVDLRQ
jgi:hypothetical protein